ncbi:MAG: sugar ABC transporter permease [Clostridia bacterium]|nr:sugar ABC transporter permease [Clostridia bacterium]
MADAKTKEKRKTLIGILLQIPIWILSLCGGFKLLSVFVLSFTDYNLIESPKFIGFNNYSSMLENEIVIKAFSNTVIYTVAIGILLIVFAVIPALLIAKTKLPFGLVTMGLFGFISVLALLGNWSYIFSGDSHGYINAIGMSLGFLDRPIIWTSQEAPAISAMIMFLACLAPIYAVTYIFARMKHSAVGSAVAICAIPILMVLSYNCATRIVGCPSNEYSADWLPTIFTDYFSTRFEVGYAYAILLVGILLLLVWSTVSVLAVLGVSVALKYIKIKTIVFKILGYIAFVCSLISSIFSVLFAAFNISLALKPMEELLTFPPSFFALRPTFQNFKSLLDVLLNSNVSFGARILNGLLGVGVLILIYIVTVLPCGIGAALVKKSKWKLCLFLPLVLLFGMSPMLQTTYYISRIRIGYMASGLAMAFLVFVTYWIINTVFCKQQRKTPKIVLGIFTLLSWVLSVCNLVVLWCPYNAHEEVTRSFYGVIELFLFGGIARSGVASAGGILIILITGSLLIIPLTLTAILYIVNRISGKKTKKQEKL